MSEDEEFGNEEPTVGSKIDPDLGLRGVLAYDHGLVKSTRAGTAARRHALEEWKSDLYPYWKTDEDWKARYLAICEETVKRADLGDKTASLWFSERLKELLRDLESKHGFDGERRVVYDRDQD